MREKNVPDRQKGNRKPQWLLQFPWGRNGSIFQRIVRACLPVAAAAVLITACGADKQTGKTDTGSLAEESGTGADDGKSYVYVTKVTPLDASYVSNFLADGKYAYYSRYLDGETTEDNPWRRMDLETMVEEPLPLGEPKIVTTENGDATERMIYMLPDGDGGYIWFLSGWGSTATPACYLCKGNSDWEELSRQDITESFAGNYPNIWSAALDGEGRLYTVMYPGSLLLYERDGSYAGLIAAESEIGSLCRARNGKMYFTCSDNMGQYRLMEADFENKTAKVVCESFPSEQLTPGIEKDFLVSSEGALHDYDLETQEYKQELKWAQYGILNTDVDHYALTEGGKVVALLQDGMFHTIPVELACLTRMEPSQVPQKQELVIGALANFPDLNSAVAKFNRSSDKYSVRVQGYYTNTDPMTAFDADLVAGKQIDIVALERVRDERYEKYVAKGVLEDLAPYMEASAKLRKEDLVDSIVRAYTHDGKLLALPTTFELKTLVGRQSDLGAKMGWTLQEMTEYIDSHPDQEPFQTATKSAVFSSCLKCSLSAFIDWEKAECYFDSQEFIDLLKFSNRFPADPPEWMAQHNETGRGIAEGTALLREAWIYRPLEYSRVTYPFRDYGGATCVGYPNAAGNIGCILNSYYLYGINAQSANKDGAWAFMEHLFSYYPKQMAKNGFPVTKRNLEQVFADAMIAEYEVDENGDYLLDQDGNKIQRPKIEIRYVQDNNYTDFIYASTQEEIDQMRALIDGATPPSAKFRRVLAMIEEEVPSYFSGQKSAEDVAAIIQSRVQIFVSENAF